MQLKTKTKLRCGFNQHRPISVVVKDDVTLRQILDPISLPSL